MFEEYCRFAFSIIQNRDMIQVTLRRDTEPANLMGYSFHWCMYAYISLRGHFVVENSRNFGNVGTVLYLKKL